MESDLSTQKIFVQGIRIKYKYSCFKVFRNCLDPQEIIDVVCSNHVIIKRMVKGKYIQDQINNKPSYLYIKTNFDIIDDKIILFSYSERDILVKTWYNSSGKSIKSIYRD